MKKLLLTLLFTSVAFTSAADEGLYKDLEKEGVYKGLEEEGNIIYSDKPFYEAKPYDEATKIDPPPLTVIEPPKVTPKEETVEVEKAAEFKYSSFKVLSPTNGQLIWNEPDLTVKLQLKPDLNIEEGHTIWLLMDGKPLVKNSRSLSLQIGRSDRGEHQIQALIRNKKGKIVKRSQSVTIHMKYTVISR